MQDTPPFRFLANLLHDRSAELHRGMLDLTAASTQSNSGHNGSDKDSALHFQAS